MPRCRCPAEAPEAPPFTRFTRSHATAWGGLGPAMGVGPGTGMSPAAGTEGCGGRASGDSVLRTSPLPLSS